jgi:hypothetical protein
MVAQESTAQKDEEIIISIVKEMTESGYPLSDLKAGGGLANAGRTDEASACSNDL